MHILASGTPSSCDGDTGVYLGFHLDSGKWAVVTGFQAVNEGDGKTICKPVVEQNLDSAPASCN